MKIRVQKNVNGCWYWLLVAGNGEILANSEAYSSKSNCMKTAKMVAKAGSFEIECK